MKKKRGRALARGSSAPPPSTPTREPAAGRPQRLVVDAPRDGLRAEDLPPGAQVVIEESVTRAEFEMMSGPLPHPGLLDAYAQHPGVLEHILESAKSEREHRHEMQKREADRADKVVEGTFAVQRGGQWAGFGLGAVALVAAAACAYFQQPLPAAAIGGGGLTAILGSSVLAARAARRRELKGKGTPSGGDGERPSPRGDT